MKMTRKRKISILSILILLFISLDFAYAACDSACPMFCNPFTGINPCDPLSGGNATGISTVAGGLIVMIKFLYSVVGLFSLFFIVIGGIKYVISAGNEESIKSAKNTLTAAVAGLAIALMAYGIVKVLERVLMVRN